MTILQLAHTLNPLKKAYIMTPSQEANDMTLAQVVENFAQTFRLCLPLLKTLLHHRKHVPDVSDRAEGVKCQYVMDC